MTEIRKIELVAASGRGWSWRDAVTFERGTTPTELVGAQPGDVLVVELRAKGLGWVIERVVETAAGIVLATPETDVEVPSQPAWTLNDEDVTELYSGDLGAWTPPQVGELRTIFQAIDRRSTAARDIGSDGKTRPAVVVSIDPVLRQAGLRPVYGTNSAVRRQGTGQRLRAWREAGLRKSGYIAADVVVRSYDDIGPRIGELSGPDRKLIR